MVEKPKGGRVPFDMRLHVPPMAQTSYNADHYHAMKRLVSEGYITIKPNEKLMLGPCGVWEAVGQPPLAETVSREESPIEPYISAETVDLGRSLEPRYSHDSLGSNYIGEEQIRRFLRLREKAEGMLNTKHDNAHPAWTILQEKLDSTYCIWDEEALERAIVEANDEEVADWNAFSASHAYCSGSRPEARHVTPVNALIKALCNFCGQPMANAWFPDHISAADEGDKFREDRRVNTLRQVAETRDPSSATSIIRYVELVQIARDFGHGRQSILTAMEELYDCLEAMIKGRMLGSRIMELVNPRPVTDLGW